MASDLVVMDKMPGARPLGIGENYCRLFAKLVIKDCGSQVKLFCGASQVYVGLEVGIEGVIYSVNQKLNLSNTLSFLEPNMNTIITIIIKQKCPQ